MAGKLNNTQIHHALEKVRLSGSTIRLTDGANLLLQIKPTGKGACAISWIFRYQILGKRREMGLGSYPTLSPSKARHLRDQLRDRVKAGIDPVFQRTQERMALAAQLQVAERNSITFERCVELFLLAKEAQWSNSKHRQQWHNTLYAYAMPVLGQIAVSAIATDQILAVVTPIWACKTETAKRVLGRIERILDYAKSMGYRDGDNPARWRGHIENTLPSPGKIQRVQHQRALPHALAPKLAGELVKIDTPAARALLLTLLCATRTGETLGAKWAEIDFERRLWTIPAERMKAGRTHRIPLTDAAVALLRLQRESTEGDYVYPGQRTGRTLSNMAMTSVGS